VCDPSKSVKSRPLQRAIDKEAVVVCVPLVNAAVAGEREYHTANKGYDLSVGYSYIHKEEIIPKEITPTA
jgi:hypothetical protein